MPKVYFKSVTALPRYHLLIVMETGNIIHFDMKSRLNTMRFGELKDIDLFNSVKTDGTYLIFGDGKVKIGASELMDLLMTDRIREEEVQAVEV